MKRVFLAMLSFVVVYPYGVQPYDQYEYPPVSYRSYYSPYAQYGMPLPQPSPWILNPHAEYPLPLASSRSSSSSSSRNSTVRSATTRGAASSSSSLDSTLQEAPCFSGLAGCAKEEVKGLSLDLLPCFSWIWCPKH